MDDSQTNDLVEEKFSNGEFAKDLKHFLVLNAHDAMTIRELEELALYIHEGVESAFYAAKGRAANDTD